MSIPERLKSLRAKMEEKGIDVYIIPTADFHQSEYVGEYFKARHCCSYERRSSSLDRCPLLYPGS